MDTQAILITGGAGYIGTALTQALVDRGHTVVIFDDLSTGQKNKIPDKATLVEGDVTVISEIMGVMSERKFDVVIHLAARKAVGEGETDPYEYYRVNVSGTRNVLEAMKECGVPSIVFSSTAAVYKPNTDGVYQEEDDLQANSVYGSTKILCEEMITQYARLGYIESYTIFRYFNLAGDAGVEYHDTNAQNVFPILAEATNRGAEFAIFGDDYNTPDGTPIRDYIHLSDLVEAHRLVLGRGHQEVFNLGTNEGTSVQELVEAFEEVANEEVNRAIYPRRAGDVAKAVADCTKAQTVLGWRPQKDLRGMIQTSLEIYE